MLRRNIGLLVAICLLMVVMGCDFSPDDSRRSGEVQQDVMGRAFAAVPPYRPTKFTAREDINWYLRATEGRHTWYTYALAMDGRPLFYVVSDMKPRNICVSITQPDRRIANSNGAVVMSAPALDGVYYGGAGCDAYYMRDATTGGFIELSGRSFTLISARTPLFLETDIVRLQPKPEKTRS